jgi:copper resistance protein D
VTAESGLIAARFVHFAALAVLFGLAVFPRYALRGEHRVSALPLRRVLAGAALTGFLSALFWFAFATASMTGSAANAADPASLLLVAHATQFGQIWMLRLVLLAALTVLLLVPSAERAATTFEALLAGIIVASLAGVWHGGEGQGIGIVMHRFADAVHLLAGSLWIGALVALLLLYRTAHRTADGANLFRRALLSFSGVGPGVVVLLLFTGLVNSWFLVGPEHALSLASSSYGLVLAAKIFLFAAMLLFAAANRYWLTPRLGAALEQQHAGAAIHRLRLSLLAETGVALLVLGAVAVLGTLPPPDSL